MDMTKDFDKVILLNKEIIKRGSTSDDITDYSFKNTLCSIENLVKEVQRLSNALSVQKGTEKWLECTHEVRVIDEDKIVIRFVFPYCG